MKQIAACFVALFGVMVVGLVQVTGQPSVTYSTCNGAMNSKCSPVVSHFDLVVQPASSVVLSVELDGTIRRGDKRLEELSADELRAVVRDLVDVIRKSGR